MNDDELVERLRRALHTEADMLTPGHGTPRVTPVSARRRHRLGLPNSGYMLVAAVAVIAAIVVIATSLGHAHARVTLAVGGSTTSSSPPASSPPASSSTRPSSPVTNPRSQAESPVHGATTSTTQPTPSVSSGPSTSPTPPTTVAGSEAPAIVSVAADFVPLSATFVTADDGWVLGVQDCGRGIPCLKLDVTTDRGTTWRAEAAPVVTGLPTPAATDQGDRPDLQVRFATPEIGWIFGTVDKTPVIYWTDDGGESWNPDALPPRFAASQIEDLETANGKVQMAFLTASGGVAIATAPVAIGAPTWTESGVKTAGQVTSAQLVIQDNAGWLVALNGTAVVGGARIVGTTWQPWSPPCGAQAGPAILAASTPRNVIAVCGRPGHQELDVSASGGSSFTTKLSLGSLEVTTVTSGEPSAALLGTSQGTVASLSISTKALTTANPPAAAPGQSVVQIGFEDGAQGLLITANRRGGSLYLTASAGLTWTLVELGS